MSKNGGLFQELKSRLNQQQISSKKTDLKFSLNYKYLEAEINLHVRACEISNPNLNFYKFLCVHEVEDFLVLVGSSNRGYLSPHDDKEGKVKVEAIWSHFWMQLTGDPLAPFSIFLVLVIFENPSADPRILDVYKSFLAAV